MFVPDNLSMIVVTKVNVSMQWRQCHQPVSSLYLSGVRTRVNKVKPIMAEIDILSQSLPIVLACVVNKKLQGMLRLIERDYGFIWISW